MEYQRQVGVWIIYYPLPFPSPGVLTAMQWLRRGIVVANHINAGPLIAAEETNQYGVFPFSAHDPDQLMANCGLRA
jgi:hypothetical protein